MEPTGLQDKRKLLEGGFSADEVAQWETEQRNRLSQGGFSTIEIDKYFGTTEPDTAPIQAMIQSNLANAKANSEGQVEQADSFMSAIEAGLEMSVAGLLTTGKPDTLLPENAPLHHAIAAQLGTLAGDAAFMVAGALEGGATGAAVGSLFPGAGTAVGGVVGAGAGAFALPTAMREVLMDYYERGEMVDFADFWERSSAILISTLKSGVLGGATAGVGGAVGKAVAKPLAGKAIQSFAVPATQRASEVATMVSLGSAIEGEVPSANDFVEAGIMVGGLAGAGLAARKIRNVYKKNGIKPADVALEAQRNPVMKQEVLSKNIQVPKELNKGEAQAKILSKVGEKGTTVKSSVKNAPKELYTNFVDKFDPIKRATEVLADPKKLATDTNPYRLARMANDFPAKVKHFIERSPLEFKTLAETGKSFKKIVDPFKKDFEGFKSYLIAKRALEVEKTGRKSGFDVEASKVLLKEGKAKYDVAARELVEFQNSVLKYAKDSGVIGAKDFSNMVEAGKAYLPFTRILEEGGLAKGKASPVKALKGSESKIQDPFTSILENTELLIKLSETNRAKRAFVDLAQKNKEVSLIEQVKSKDSQLSKDILSDSLNVKNARIAEFDVMIDGKKQTYRTEANLAEAVKRIDGDPVTSNLVMKLAKNVSTVKKIGITLTPDFIVRNVFRDQLTAGTFSKGKVIPFVDIASSVGNIFRQDKVYFNWLKSGGANGSFIELNKNYLERNVFKLNKDAGNFIDRTWNVVRKPVDYLVAAGQIAENATRLAEFKNVSKGKASGSKIFEGGFASREATIDFQRIGAKMSAYNAITAFQNVSIQGLDRTVRAIKDNPMGVTVKGLTYITAPSVLLWWANKDDVRYQQRPRWEKDLFWHLPLDDWQEIKEDEVGDYPEQLVRRVGDKFQANKGEVLRFPKPQELGILFGSVPERILESFFTENPNALKDFERTVGELVTPSIIPDLARAPMEQFFNKNIFTDRPIIPYPLQGLSPEYQYKPYTSETAKMIGNLIGAVPAADNNSFRSPLMVEHYIRSWSGSLGGYILQGLDLAWEKSGVTPPTIKPVSTLADIPFIKAFAVRNPTAQAQSIQDFYEEYEKAKRAVSDFKHLQSTAQVELLGELISEPEFEESVAAFAALEGVKKTLTNINATIQKTYKNPDFSAEEQRQIIDASYYQMIEAAKMGNSMVREMRKSLKESRK